MSVSVLPRVQPFLKLTLPLLSLGAFGISFMGLFGADLGAAIPAFQASHTTLAPMLKFGVAFPLVYHYAAGIRHLVTLIHAIAHCLLMFFL